MRTFAALSLMVAAPATAQFAVSPAAEYITPGQDEAGYRSWATTNPARPAAVAAYYAFLVQHRVAGVVPTWQLLRTATDWQKCAAQPFEVPPPEYWPNIVETLDYVRAHVVPVIGAVEPVSVYRNPVLNACAHGAPQSAHGLLYALDLVPLRPIERDALIQSLCAVHFWRGAEFNVGLGFYKGVRFHIDSKKFREWGASGESSLCLTTADELAPVAVAPPTQ